MSNCFIKAMSMVTGINEAKIIKQVGHDGTQIVFPNARFPYCCRGFHKQELIDVAIKNQWMVITVQSNPGLSPFVGDDPDFSIPWDLAWYLDNFDGIICGANSDRSHAVAWVNKQLIDKGKVIETIDFEIIEFLGFKRF